LRALGGHGPRRRSGRRRGEEAARGVAGGRGRPERHEAGLTGQVREALARTQRAFLKEVISSQHVFLEDDQSMEVLLVQGPSERLNDLCDALRKVRGVQQIKLVSTTAILPPLHDNSAAHSRKISSAKARK
ncbi:MAG: hypothetical protein ABW199_09620, partial [Caulobacterales bacterium]